MLKLLMFEHCLDSVCTGQDEQIWSEEREASNQTASSNVHEVVSSTPVTSISVNSLTGVPYSASLTKQNVSVDSVQLTQATRPMRRLYVENVPASASEKAVMEFLNNIFLSSDPGRERPSTCGISYTRGCFSALSCDGCSFSGCILRIRHPKDFIETAKVKEEDTELEPAKEMKRKSSSRRKSSSHQSKAKARKSGGNSADGAKLDKPNIVDEP
ncbi:hypothetical protein LWI28_007820 [Acer negundo]|uniref:RRM domain-containing protein n=1 Tax=Acer negundo TaxID=4023 RepID=A0AAD5P3V9_ACENE|nr:hypothetical protein LWI28_007820 [Acer negundo]